jgi:DNA-binding IclR family transcriptional regulator
LPDPSSDLAGVHLNLMNSSTHARSLGAQKPGLSPANRSLERGIEILRAFRPGSELLGNAEIAERTGLSRATVSRLTQTLVGSGYLQVEPRTRAYRLAPPVLSLAHAMRSGSTALAIAAPHMRAAAQMHRVNVGLAAPDRDEMVYLESIRYNRRPSLRTVVSGQRVPMELTSLGRAYLASAPEEQRKVLLAYFRRVRRAQWADLEPALAAAIRSVDEHGYCAAAWQPEVVAVATSLLFRGSHYALNMSVSTAEPFAEVVRELAPTLLALRVRVQHELDTATDAW